jgi:ABC-type lipoprotein export system ATPase subunit
VATRVSATAVIELRDVFCVHRTPEGDAASLQGATLAVGRGELLAVIGPSGAGKSTLLRTIAGLQTPSAGVVRVLGHDIGRLPPRRRGLLRHELLGFLGQRPELLLAPDLSARAAIELPLALRGAEPAARHARAAELLERVGLSARAGARPAELSGGERQRVALCAALAHRPAVLLADEPTGELDPASADAVRGLIGELARADGVTAILVSHDPATESFADRCVRIRDGRVVEDRRNGDSALVLGRGGWVQVPDELLSAAGIGDRVHIRRERDGLLVTPAPVTAHAASLPARPGPSVHPALPPSPAETWSPATVRLSAVTRIRADGSASRTVLASLTRELGPGGLIAVSGRSGAGKSTLLRLIAGLERPDSGQVAIDGEPLDWSAAEQLATVRRERIGYLRQEPVPIGFMSAHENVALALRVRGADAADADARARSVLAAVGLAEHARQRVARLSAGEVQRVALARALACARGLLLVDEPTSRLDAVTAAATASLLAAASRGGQTVICATHDPELLRVATDALEL